MAAQQVFVSNIPWKATEDDVRALFEEGRVSVESVKILQQEDTLGDGTKVMRSRGFGFVTLGNGDDPNAVIDRMNGKPLLGRTIMVALAKGTKR